MCRGPVGRSPVRTRYLPGCLGRSSQMAWLRRAASRKVADSCSQVLAVHFELLFHVSQAPRMRRAMGCSTACMSRKVGQQQPAQHPDVHEQHEPEEPEPVVAEGVVAVLQVVGQEPAQDPGPVQGAQGDEVEGGQQDVQPHQRARPGPGAPPGRRPGPSTMRASGPVEGADVRGSSGGPGWAPSGGRPGR